jgi:hypothetical protein
MRYCHTYLFVCLAFGGSALAIDLDGFPNLVAQSKLPHGLGLAAEFPADTGIGSHPDVIFSDNFETTKSTPLGERWDEPGIGGGKALSLVSPDDNRCGAHCLRVRAVLKENQGDGLTKWFEPASTVFIRFYVRFDEGCDYTHHFVKLRGNKGLSGSDKWSGFGGSGTRPQGDERFSTSLEPWGDWGRWPAPGRWNFYSYWYQMKASPDGKHWGNSFIPDDQPNIPKSKWICAEFMLKHNTPGIADGEQALWIDGQLRGHWTGIPWRRVESLQANSLTLESYVTERWTKNPINIVDFDNVVIAKSYIGPVGSVQP